MENLTQGWSQSGPLFLKAGQFFGFSKKAREAFTLLSSCAPVIVAQYDSISLNMPKYLWMMMMNDDELLLWYGWPTKLFWLCQASEYGSYMFDRLLKMPAVLNKPGFWIWYGCICKGYLEFRLCLIMVPYASIMPEYASIKHNALSKPAHGWILLNVPEYTWKCLDKFSYYDRVLNGPRYSYNSLIIIVTNIIILKFLYARFVHPGALLPFYLFLTWVRT